MKEIHESIISQIRTLLAESGGDWIFRDESGGEHQPSHVFPDETSTTKPESRVVLEFIDADTDESVFYEISARRITKEQAEVP